MKRKRTTRSSLLGIVFLTLCRTSAALITSNNDYKCSLFTFIPFTSIHAETNEREDSSSFINDGDIDNLGYNQLVAAIIAMQDFNAKAVDTVMEMVMYHDCPVTMDWNTSKFFDTGSIGHQAIQSLVTADVPPCAVAGPYNDQPALELQTVATAAKLPQVIARGFNSKLASGPYTSMVFPDLYASREVVTSFLKEQNRTNYISLLHTLTESGIQQREAFGLALDRDSAMNRTTDDDQDQKTWWNAFGYQIGLQTREVIDALKGVQQSGYRTIVVTMDDPAAELQHIADAAEQLKLNNRGASDTDYFWIFWGDFHPDSIFSDLDKPNDNVAQLLDGAVWFYPNIFSTSPFRVNWEYGLFDMLRAEQVIKAANAYGPIQDPSQPGYFRGNANYFRSNTPELGASLLFDAIIAIGIGSCLAYYEEAGFSDEIAMRSAEFYSFTAPYFENPDTTSLPTLKDYQNGLSQNFFKTLQPQLSSEKPSIEVEGAAHAEGIRHAHFFGASGFVRFLDSGQGSTSSRNPREFSWLAVNMNPIGVRQQVEIRAGIDVDDDDYVESMDELLLLDHYIVSAYNPQFPESEQWTELRPFIYADGTTEQPKLLRTTPEQNYLNPLIQKVGLGSMLVTIALAFASGIWVCINRNHKVLKASQPLFLYILFAGTAVTVSSIYAISFDESFGWSEEELSDLCVALPWFFVVGLIMTYGALFAKLWRVNRVLQFSRSKINVRQVAWPIALLMMLALVVLTLFTIHNPPHWDRRVIDEVTGESIGSCRADNAHWFGAPLAVVTITPLFLTGRMAWKTKDVDQAFSEAYWIFVLIFVQLEVIFVSMPVIVILIDVSSSGRYIGFASIILVFSASSLVLVMMPKLIAYYKKEDAPTNARSRLSSGQVRVTGIDSTSRTSQERLSKTISADVARKVERQETAKGKPQSRSEVRSSISRTDQTGAVTTV